MNILRINKPDEALRPAIQEKIDNLNKPKGSLGRLEEIAMQVCLIQQTLSPSLAHPCHLLFGGDHGIEREGVSVSPREVTWQQMINFTHGGGGVKAQSPTSEASRWWQPSVPCSMLPSNTLLY